MVNLEGLVKALEAYFAAQSALDVQELSLVGPESEMEMAAEEVWRALAGYIEALAAEAEALKHAHSQAVHRLNKLKAEQARLKARGDLTGQNLSKLLKTLTELEQKGS